MKCRPCSWTADRFRDLFFGPGNHFLDLARLLAALAIVAELAGEAWNVHLRQPVDLAALGGGLAAILTASAGYVAAKDWAGTQRIKARAQLLKAER